MTPSREELIADIRRAAIACNSEIVEKIGPSRPGMVGQLVRERPIRLADLLDLIIHTYEQDFGEPTIDLVSCWNLRNDDLNAQSDEVLLFIHGLVK